MIKTLALMSTASSAELLVAESLMRGSNAGLRRSQWSLKGQ